MSVQIRPTETDWTSRARCSGRDDDIFFVKSLPEAKEAIKICQRCPVRQECLDYSIAEGIDVGVWGGLTSRQRTSYAARRSEAHG